MRSESAMFVSGMTLQSDLTVLNIVTAIVPYKCIPTCQVKFSQMDGCILLLQEQKSCVI